MFSSKGITVLVLICLLLIHFELILYSMGGKDLFSCVRVHILYDLNYLKIIDLLYGPESDQSW